MKKTILVICILFIFQMSLHAQQYPYMQDFEGYSSFSAPNDWTHTSPGFQIYPTRGVNGSKAMIRELFNLSTSDSVISPLIGPVNSQSMLSFDYRIVEYIGSTPISHTLTSGDQIEIKVDDGTGSPITEYLIDMNNHIDNASYSNISIGLGSYAGLNINIMIKGIRASGDFFIEIDNFMVQDATSSGHINADKNEIKLFPNPFNNYLLVSSAKKSDVLIFDLTGKKVLETQTGIDNNIINTEELKCGNYLIKVISDESAFWKSIFIKE